MRNAQKPVGYHLVLRSHYPLKPFTNREFCVHSWALLRRHFPSSFAVMLMPNHFHLLVDGTTGDRNTTVDKNWARGRLVLVSRALSKAAGKSLWQPVTEPEPIPDWFHLKRQIRYVHLNPCRKKLCFDPMEWEWSTHRDYLGATANPWPNTSKILKKLEFGETKQAAHLFHSYVSGDPSVRIEGTPPPTAPAQPYIGDLVGAADASLSALRISHSILAEKGRGRALLMRTLAYQLGVPKYRVAELFGISPNSIERPLAERIQEDLNLARSLALLMNDSRLRKREPFSGTLLKQGSKAF